MTEPSRAPEQAAPNAIPREVARAIQRVTGLAFERGKQFARGETGDSGDGLSELRAVLLAWNRRSATPASPAESGWVIVIDLPAVGLGYWDGHAFPPDNLKAVRFARKYDAEVVRGSIKEWQARTEEHGWG